MYYMRKIKLFLASIKPSNLRAKFENMAKQEEEENEKRRLEEQERRKQRELLEKKEAQEREEKRLKELQEKEEQKQKLLAGPEQVNSNKTPIIVRKINILLFFINLVILRIYIKTIQLKNISVFDNFFFIL